MLSAEVTFLCRALWTRSVEKNIDEQWNINLVYSTVKHKRMSWFHVLLSKRMISYNFLCPTCVLLPVTLLYRPFLPWSEIRFCVSLNTLIFLNCLRSRFMLKQHFNRNRVKHAKKLSLHSFNDFLAPLPLTKSTSPLWSNPGTATGSFIDMLTWTIACIL